MGAKTSKPTDDTTNISTQSPTHNPTEKPTTQETNQSDHPVSAQMTYRVKCEYLIYGFINSITGSIHDSLYQLCLAFYGHKIIDSVIISINEDGIQINCDILKQYLYPNGTWNDKRYFNEFDIEQRSFLYKLLLITKYKNIFTFKSELEYEEMVVTDLEDGRTVLTKYHELYPGELEYYDENSLISFLGTMTNTDKYTQFLLYTSLRHNICPLYFIEHDDKLKQRLQQIDHFWNGRKSFFGNGKNVTWYLMNECRVGKTAAFCLIDECLRLLYPEIYDIFRVKHRWTITASYYSQDISALYVGYFPKARGVIRDYLLLFGVGYVVLFQVAFVSLQQNEIKQVTRESVMSPPFELRFLLSSGPKDRDLELNEIIQRVNMLKASLNEKYPEILKAIILHPTDLEVAIDTIQKYWKSPI